MYLDCELDNMAVRIAISLSVYLWRSPNTKMIKYLLVIHIWLCKLFLSPSDFCSRLCVGLLMTFARVNRESSIYYCYIVSKLRTVDMVVIDYTISDDSV